ncbi:MAG TPA: ROK family protein, partial [Bryobacterales bacterium]|nr:ROK family protein [Bryobacterales bacterium]
MSELPLFLGIDVGGTNIKLGLVRDDGRVVGEMQVPTREPEGPEAGVERMAEAARKLVGQADLGLSDVTAAGLATPGSMDLERGWLLQPPNMPHWCEFPIRDRLAERLGRPVVFLNDANAAAYGEFWQGSGAGAESLVMLTLGTGVGGGIIVAGELVHGRHSFGSEIGHMIVDPSPDARTCVWGGGRGELEAYASASAVVARTRERLESHPSSRLAAADPLTARSVFEAAEADDPLALEIIDETADILGIAITTLVHLIDPGRVVLGGAMDFGGPDHPVGQRFLGRIRRVFHERA